MLAEAVINRSHRDLLLPLLTDLMSVTTDDDWSFGRFTLDVDALQVILLNRGSMVLMKRTRTIKFIEVLGAIFGIEEEGFPDEVLSLSLSPLLFLSS
jgi:hypothetical protein